jgi:hypothetical protein
VHQRSRQLLASLQVVSGGDAAALFEHPRGFLLREREGDAQPILHELAQVPGQLRQQLALHLGAAREPAHGLHVLQRRAVAFGQLRPGRSEARASGEHVESPHGQTLEREHPEPS